MSPGCWGCCHGKRRSPDWGSTSGGSGLHGGGERRARHGAGLEGPGPHVHAGSCPYGGGGDGGGGGCGLSHARAPVLRALLGAGLAGDGQGGCGHYQGGPQCLSHMPVSFPCLGQLTHCRSCSQ